MENICKNFDEESKIIVKELTQNNDKLNKLIDKLQTAMIKMNNEVKIVENLVEDLKK